MALSISIFYAIGTGLGGFIGPALYGTLIETGSRDAVFLGYAIAGLVRDVQGGSKRRAA